MRKLIIAVDLSQKINLLTPVPREELMKEYPDEIYELCREVIQAICQCINDSIGDVFKTMSERSNIMHPTFPLYASSISHLGAHHRLPIIKSRLAALCVGKPFTATLLPQYGTMKIAVVYDDRTFVIWFKSVTRGGRPHSTTNRMKAFENQQSLFAPNEGREYINLFLVGNRRGYRPYTFRLMQPLPSNGALFDRSLAELESRFLNAYSDDLGIQVAPRPISVPEVPRTTIGTQNVANSGIKRL